MASEFRKAPVVSAPLFSAGFECRPNVAGELLRPLLCGRAVRFLSFPSETLLNTILVTPQLGKAHRGKILVFAALP
jgi:hypothetical protein